MKSAFAVATLAAFTQAYYLDEYVKDAPDGMVPRRPTKRFEGRGRDRVFEQGADYDALSRQCKRNVKEFDKYCHNVGSRGERKYSDYRDANGQCSQCTIDDSTGLCTDRSLEP